MGRRIAIWVFGLLASGIFGGLIGRQFAHIEGAYWGVLGGAFAFACVRLWLADQSR